MFDDLLELAPAALVGVVESVHRQESMLVARRLAAVANLLEHRVAATADQVEQLGYATVDPYIQTAAEVAAAMNLSALAAGFVVSDAEALDRRFPKIGAALAAGHTDWATVKVIIRRAELVSDDKVAALDASLSARLGAWQGWSRQRVINAVDAAVRAHDPDAIRERRRDAEDKRRIDIRAGEHGMGEISGTMAATGAAALDRRLAQLATGVCAGDPRSLDQRRADALGALAQGQSLVCRCGQPHCPTKTAPGPADPSGVATVIHVLAGEQTVHGDSEQPGYLEGYGVIDAEQVRALAAAASLVPVVDPVTSAGEALRYQPSAALARAVRCRDLTCRFPGCSRPALYADIDHTIPFNHADPAAGGRTVLTNLKCLCRLHHRLKTFGGWRDEQLPDATVVWTSPSGRTYRTAPAGADLFAPPRAPACAVPTPSRRPNRSRRRSTRIARARQHNRELRPLNHARRQFDQARKDEIEGRKFRNHMRDMLFAFKGAPSTSPFCPWINDPYESEELPPDWTPPEPEPVPDDPPF
ncbi:HNH nuclease [Mycobacterium sp. 852002-51163_SCH5372311]|uniref:HNH endonuclease signature motif containing protein n=1 Tax=Mycobacterium sp. 852002-51163_SCH5372311 TaxID=1834097 RepID=UPI0007FE48F3|nr:HNH endonuclease signature motif containing protein [Mycobacterium sp. 852002-51163_SCH5372311]OBF80557.1 HNH nuclease [Mycobacterium sp. 852002-51163_SCH5372311]